ncbi:MJ0042-type zinc finger domain-containing protein [Stappia indica]|uniref:Thioredoxin n=1 Tax=Stappia indica TaxID=538381 RepID=A0A857C8B4_9HYPH|nr:MJ0042-type zinc finger domain-containing protein [Stappia indica]QGZ35108.1 thioredoxin [Stappia indica]
MKITCPDCATAYRVSPAALGPEGRDVKCARCGTRWHALPTPDTASIETELPDRAEAAEGETVRAKAAAMAEAGEAGSIDPADEWEAALSAADENGDDSSDGDEQGDGEAGTAEEDEGEDVFSSMLDADETSTDDADGLADEDAAAGSAPSSLPVAADAMAAGEAEAAAAKTVDIESLARKPKIHVKPRSSEPILRRVLSAAGQQARRVRPRRVVGMMMFFGAVALCALAVTFRTPIVARMPDLAGLFQLAGLHVNLRGLEFRDLRTFREIEDGSIVLVIEGTIANVEKQPMPVPAIRLALRSEDAQEIYAWTMEPRLRRLDVGGTTRFRTRLSAPPDLAADIQVRFVEREQRQARLK